MRLKTCQAWCDDEVITEVTQTETVSSNNYVFVCIKIKEPLTGKSFIINIVAQWCEKILRADGDNIDHPYVIKAAFMGGAAANIGGQTLHSAFKLPLSSSISAMKNQKIQDNLMTLLKNLRLGKIFHWLDIPFLINVISVIIDEFSMLKADMLYQLDFRLW